MTPVAVPARETVRLYTVREAAALIGKGKDWVYERIRDGRLRYVELGDTQPCMRLRADDLQTFIDSRTHGRCR